MSEQQWSADKTNLGVVELCDYINTLEAQLTALKQRAEQAETALAEAVKALEVGKEALIWASGSFQSDEQCEAWCGTGAPALRVLDDTLTRIAELKEASGD